MSTIIYHDLTRGCLTAAQKLFIAAGGDSNARWSLELDGNTAGLSEHYGHWTLTLPLLPLDARMTRQERGYWTAYTIHETGHAVFSDFSVWRDAVRQGLGDIVNALEDVRQEAKIIRDGLASNARPLFEALCAHILRKGLDNGWQPSAHGPSLAFTLCLYGRVEVSGYSIAGLPAMDSATSAALAWIWPELAACASTADVLALAQKIRRKQSSQGESSQGQGSQGQDSRGAGSQGQGGNGVSGAARNGGAFGLSGLEADIQDIAQAARNRTGNVPAKRLTSDARLAAAPRPNVALQDRGSPTRTKSLEIVFPSLSKLKADVTRLVRSPERVGTQGGLLHGRLDGGAIVRAQTGAEDCFLRRDIAEGVNTAVAIVLDGSGSMNSGNKSRYAHAMALAIGDALDRAAVPFEISVTGVAYNRDQIIYKPFGGAWRKHRDNVGAMAGWSGTCNLVGAQSAVDRLATVRDVSRRLLFVLSDGQDIFGDADWKRAQELWAIKGIETIGVGLMHNVSGAFPVHVNVASGEQLAREGLGLLVRKLSRAA